ncbi:MAG: LapA family protein [Cyclobacteriaceae bacterium]
MRYIRIIFILLIALVIVVFSVQNAEVVEVRFLGWRLESSRALIMLVCVGIGSLGTILALLPAIFGRKEKENTDTDE